MNIKTVLVLGIVSTLIFGTFVGINGAQAYNKINTALNEKQVSKILQTMAPPPAPVRQPAEFEPMQGVLVRYPFGISYNIIKEMSEDVEVVTIVASISEKNYVYNQYQSTGVNINNCDFLIAPSNSYWTRDYGPWFIFNGNNEQGIVDFTYNRPRPNDDAIPGAYAANQSLPLYFMSLEHSGGNYMTDGQGIAISTTLAWEENLGYTHEQINQMLHDYCGISTYHVVPDVNGEYIKHIDCWGKYLSPDTIMIRQVPPSHTQYDEIEAAVSYFENQTSCYGTPYQVVRVYTPGNEPYTNSLILNNKVLVPIIGNQWDDDAIVAYQNAMPGYEVLGFTGSWESTDALHCRAIGITDQYMLYIEHTPLSGYVNGEDGVEIQAKIFPYSGDGVTAAKIYVRINGGSWQSYNMECWVPPVYRFLIPPQQSGIIIDYFIHAEDASGRSENHPYIGGAMAHSFTIINEGTNSPPEKPQRPSGQTNGNVGETYLYSTQTTDPDEDQVYYMWDWGDGTTSDWIGPFASGATATATYSWTEQGTYSIKVKAKDINDDESAWSDPLSINMPLGQELSNNMIFQVLKIINLHKIYN